MGRMWGGGGGNWNTGEGGGVYGQRDKDRPEAKGVYIREGLYQVLQERRGKQSFWNL